MKKIRQFLCLPLSAKLLTFYTLFLLWGVRLALWFAPFRQIYRLIARYNQMDFDHSQITQEIANIVQITETMSHYVPRANCLTRAIVAQILLARHNIATTLQIGVTKSTPPKDLRAHAWLEHDGKVIMGEVEDLIHYTRLPVLLPQRPANLTDPTRKPNP